jgi:WD40 repeat protein
MRIARSWSIGVIVLASVLSAGSLPSLIARDTRPTGKKASPRLLYRLGDKASARRPLVSRLSYSPDGKMIAAGGPQSSVQVFDTATGRLLHTLLIHPKDPRQNHPLRDLGFALNGQVLVALLRDGTTRTWQTDGWTELPSFNTECYGSAVDFSPDGSLLAVPDRNNTVLLWDLRSRKKRRSLAGVEGTVSALTFSGDGKTLAAASTECKVWIWDVPRGKLLKTLSLVPPGTKGRQLVYALAYTPDDRSLIAFGSNRKIQLWEVASGRLRLEIDLPRGASSKMAVSPEGRTLYLLGSGKVYRLDLVHGKEHAPLTVPITLRDALALSPKGDQLAAGGVGLGLLELKDPTKFIELPRLPRIQRHQGRIRSVSFSGNSAMVLTAADDGLFFLWDVSTGSLLRLIDPKNPRQWRGVNRAILTPDGKQFVAGTYAGELVVWEVATGKQVRELKGARGPIATIALSPDGKVLAAGGQQGEIVLWELADGKLKTRLKGPGHQVESLAFSPDGTRIVSAGMDGTVRLWDLEKGGQGPILARGKFPVRHVAFSPRGKVIAFYDIRLHLADAGTGKEIRVLGDAKKPSTILAMAFSPDGWTLATGAYNGEVTLWDLPTGEPLCRWTEHDGRVTSLAYSPDGKYLVTGGDDKTPLVWYVQPYARTGVPPLQVVEKPEEPSAEMRELWKKLGDEDAKVAYDAILTLVGRPREAVPLLSYYLAAAPSQAQAERLVADLKSSRAAVVEDAQMKLEALGADAVPALREALKKERNRRLRRRLQRVLRRLPTQASPTPKDRLRQLRAIEVLEKIGTPEAREVLRRTLSNTTDGKLREEITRTLQRLSKQATAPAGPKTIRGGEIFKAQVDSYHLSTMALSPDGRRLFTAWSDNQERLYDLAIRGVLKTVRDDPPLAAAFAPDGKSIVTTPNVGHVRVRDAFTLRELVTIEKAHPDRFVMGAAYAPDGRTYATGGRDEVKLWEASTHKLRHTFTQTGRRCNRLAYSPDGRWLAASALEGVVIVWDLTSGKKARTLKGHSGSVIGVAFSPDGTVLATTGGDRTVRLWDGRTGKEIRTLEGHLGPVMAAVFMAKGKVLVSGGSDRSVKFWDIATGKVLLTLEVEHPVVWLGMSQDETRLAVGTSHAVLVWNPTELLGEGRE